MSLEQATTLYARMEGASVKARRRFGRPVTLTRSEFKLVECLVRHPAQVFSRDSLMDRIYDDNHIVAERSIDAYIKRLRKKFADAHPGADPIETVHGLGYKLNSKIGHDE